MTYSLIEIVNCFNCPVSGLFSDLLQSCATGNAKKKSKRPIELSSTPVGGLFVFYVEFRFFKQSPVIKNRQ